MKHHAKIFCYSAFIFVFFLTGSAAWAQNNIQAATNRSKLKDLSIHLKKRSEAARVHAQDQAKRKGWPIKKKLSDGSFIELQRLSPTGNPVYYITENADAADTVSTDELWPGGSTGLNLSGSGMTVGEWDGGGVRKTHQDLIPRVTQKDVPTTLNHYHATHVAGTIIASGVNDPTAKGMSYAANLDAYDWNNDEAEMAAAGGSGLTLSNHSYGTVTGWSSSGPTDNCNESYYWWGNISDTEDFNFGYYNYWAQQWDLIAFNAPYYLIVKSAGNDRNDFAPAAGTNYCVFDDVSVNDWIAANTTTSPRDDDCGPNGYDCISTKGTAKNILTVGAVNDINGGYQNSSQVTMSSFSGWGPTDDGRIKPDIVANGVSLWSTYNGDDADYNSSSGTSMAAPNVTGSLLLLQQHYQNTHSGSSMRSATLKALAIHTADEAGQSNGPDYAFGWGLLNSKKAAKIISSDSLGSNQIVEAELNNGVTYQILVTPSSGNEVKVTLVWTDPPGTPVAEAVDPSNLMLINDLDLRVTGNSNTYYPWILDPSNPSNAATTGDNFRDNVEQVIIPSSINGTYTIQVIHKGTLKDSSPQSFSLILSHKGTSPPYRFPWTMFLPAFSGQHQ